MQKYTLLITKDESIQPSGPVLYLGGWCLDPVNFEYADNRKIAMPLGCENITPLSKLDDPILESLSNYQERIGWGLNDIHNIQRDQKYWKTLIGPWLFIYLNHIAALYRRVQAALEQNDICTVYVKNYSYYKNSIPKTLDEFMFYTGSQNWNAMVVVDIINHLKKGGQVSKDVEIRHVTADVEPIKLDIPKDRAVPTVRDAIRNLIINLMNAIPIRENQPFIISSFLPNVHEALLKISLGASPRVFKSPNVPEMEADQALRQEFQNLLSTNQSGGLETFLYNFLANCLPLCYLEGFNTTRNLANSLDWPKNPSFIFTSGNYHWDEVFKFWSAEKRNCGVPYFIGQHGNTFGTHTFTEKCPEFHIPDKFFSWGWVRNSDRDIPAFVFKRPKRKKISYKPHRGVLLVLSTNDFRVPIVSTYTETSNARLCYIGKFYGKIRNEIKQNVTVRIMNDVTDYVSGEEKFWRSLYPGVKLELGRIPIKRLIEDYEIAIYGYDSTGVLESLAEGRPTMVMVLPEDLDLLHHDSKRDYLKLLSCGVLHLSEESAAEHLNSIYNNISAWWTSKNVRNACRRFSEKYAANADHPVLTLRSLLTSAARRPR